MLGAVKELSFDVTMHLLNEGSSYVTCLTLDSRDLSDDVNDLELIWTLVKTDED